MALIAGSGLLNSTANLGGLRHLPFVPLENASRIALQTLILQAVTVFAYGTGKFSVGYFILRLLPPSSPWSRRCVWTVISLTLFYNWLQVILTFVQCNPPSKAWDPNVIGECWTQASKFTDIYIGGSKKICLLSIRELTLTNNLQYHR